MASAPDPPGEITKSWWASNSFEGGPGPVVASGSQRRAVPSTSAQSNSGSPSAVISGDNYHEDEEDDDNNEDLTPPPDSPVDLPVENPAQMAYEESSPKPPDLPKDEQPSQLPSVPINNSEDEIVVGTKANKKSSSQPAASDPEDVDMADAEDAEYTAPYPKRKRTQTFDYLIRENDDTPPPQEEPEVRAPRMVGRPKTHGMGAVKGAILGYWRDSEPEDPRDKHAVTGFIDVRDRLRTRINGVTRDGRDITRQYPLPPGPGGSWVTFEKIAFDPHLVNLDHNQVKEYVKVRVDSLKSFETPEETAHLDAVAVKEAIIRVENNPPNESSVPVAIAYGPDIPDHAPIPHRPDKKRKHTAEPSGPFASISNTPPPHRQQTFESTGRPSRILLGYWRKSSERDPADKHAVYGILGANDMFRVKLMKETRDGRPCQGNFPNGAGALWIHWDEVEFDPHLRHLSRPEIKEYCRVRQQQIDAGEREQDRIANEEQAVLEGQRRAARIFATNPAPISNALVPKTEARGLQHPLVSNGPQAMNGREVQDYDPDVPAHHGYNVPPQGGHRRESMPLDPVRATRRTESGRGRHSFPNPELGVANRPPPPQVNVDRTNSIARREVERVEAYQNRLDQRAAPREPMMGDDGGRMDQGGPSNRAMFEDHVTRLNKVWVAQETNRMRLGAEDAKIYAGIKYERKSNGPFEGKLVSQGNIITIDGEDYVEYRVLTKPSFF